MTPDYNAVTAGRTYALGRTCPIMHTIRDICGQGLILRFSEADLQIAGGVREEPRLVPRHAERLARGTRTSS